MENEGSVNDLCFVDINFFLNGVFFMTANALTLPPTFQESSLTANEFDGELQLQSNAKYLSNTLIHPLDHQPFRNSTRPPPHCTPNGGQR